MRRRFDTARRSVFLIVVAFVFASTLFHAAGPGGDVPGMPEAARFRKSEAAKAQRFMDRLAAAEAAGVRPHQDVDARHYSLDLRVDPAQRTIQGTVTLDFRPTAPLERLTMRLHPALGVSGEEVDGLPVASPRRKGANLIFTFSPALAPGSTHTVAVSYGGSPPVSGSLNGGMMFSAHAGVPSATTLSEPFASYAWWPCVDDLADKSTMDMSLTVPPGMVGASNGALESATPQPDGWVTYHWEESYPLANYLICANVTNYATFADGYQSLDGSTAMPLDYFVYPEHEALAMQSVARVPDMIAYFAALVGEYPFLSEKYGMVAFPWGGGMEHQTLTSMGDRLFDGTDANDVIYAHELAHQWWGDEVTCASWNDIWLNEGFATYFEVLWSSRASGIPEGHLFDRYYDDHSYNGRMGPSVHLPNGDRPFDQPSVVYDKGAWVLHMLRGVVGDGAFFAGLRAYRAAHSMGSASTSDLQAAFENAYGQPLGWFFQQWVYTPKRPIYSLSYDQSDGTVTVTVSQKQAHRIRNRASSRDVYIMPVALTLHFEDGTSRTDTVWNDRRTQAFRLPAPTPVSGVGLDENHWILKVMR